MTPSTNALTAYLATLVAIVVLTLAAVVIIVGWGGVADELPRLIAALAFISGAVTGLIGVIGTFRPKVPATEGSAPQGED